MELNKEYWDTRYSEGSTGWDIGHVSRPLREYIDQLEDKNLRILIPGGGSSYEAEYLVENGFTDITIVDISEKIVNSLKLKFKKHAQVKVVARDFFEHQGEYDLVLEQTFFCALNPLLREKYYSKMNELLSSTGKIAGVMFGVKFEKQGPPFGGDEQEYKKLMKNYFEPKTIAPCYNSIPQRQGSELFIILKNI